MMLENGRTIGLLALLALSAALPAHADGGQAADTDKSPAAVSRDDLADSLFLPGKAYDVTDGARRYRIFLSVPDEPAPPEGFPLLVVLDGNANFTLAGQLAASRARWKEIPPIVVVGVGYPTTKLDEMLSRRVQDLSPTETTDPGVLANRQPGAVGGGAAEFRTFLATQLPQIVRPLASINPRCTTLYGHSLGGLFVVDTLLRAPATYRQYYASSPSLWNEKFAVLAQKTGFKERLAKGRDPIRVELAVGGAERTFPERQLRFMPALRRLPDVRMVDATVELGQWLAGLEGPRIHSQYRVIEEATHTSVMPTVVARAVDMAAACS